MRQSGKFSGAQTGLDPLWKAAVANGKRRLAANGDTLFERGDVANYLYFVVAGEVDVFRSDGKWRVIWSRTVGDVLSFDCDGQRELSCRARGAVELIAVSRRLLACAAQQDETLARRLAELNAEELKIMLSTLGDTSQMSGGNVIELVPRARLVKGLRRRDVTRQLRQADAAVTTGRELSAANQ